jgi:hypothetical protein
VYAWSCSAVLDGGAFGSCLVESTRETLALSDSNVLQFPAGTLGEGVYVFALTASKGVVGGSVPNHYRSASASVTVTVQSKTPPQLTPAQNSLKVNPGGGRVSLSVTVDSFGKAVQLLWSTPDLSATEASTLILSQSLTEKTLAFLPNLRAGAYAFVLTATTATDSLQSSTTIRVTVNSPPRNGFTVVTPSDGEALRTPFSLTTAGWTDDAEVRAMP